MENFRRLTQVRLSASSWTSGHRARCSHPSSGSPWACPCCCGPAGPGY
ncbi:hypothetical protein A176_003605 [Myxococcus hansupus]|uniref:Uncharacterized protein n=1 Tax=Pseudomyxococcus hansupus TaxID=1297742 RepID=A0A0H4WYK0_9BACT|nr:hypothetical protein A176_003605 [Myxococcus hansupus]